jgi:tetratricopeptide (TPR) repeat protein
MSGAVADIPPSRSPQRPPAGARWLKILEDDAPFILLAVAAFTAFIAVQRLYRPADAQSVFFPRVPSEFRAPAQLEDDRGRAVAVLEKDPENLQSLADLAVSEFQQGPDHYVDCAEHAERALALGALDARLFYYAAMVYEAKALNLRAAEAFEKYLRNRPEDQETRLRLGNLYYRMGELEKASAAFRKVLEARPGDPLTSFNLALTLRDREQWAEGLSLLAPLLERDKTLPVGGFRVLGDFHRGLKAPAQAVEAYQKELERSPEDPDILQALAFAWEDAGNIDEAIAAWKRVSAANPKNTKAGTRLRALAQKKKAQSRSR